MKNINIYSVVDEHGRAVGLVDKVQQFHFIGTGLISVTA
jgi:hypothetical protein